MRDDRAGCAHVHRSCLEQPAQVAICGSLLKDPVNSNALCATCSRLFKYLICDYFEEFSVALRAWVLENFQVVRVAPQEQEAHRVRVAALLALYGEEVLPASLLVFYNVTLAGPLHCPTEAGGNGNADVRDLRGRLFLELQQRLLRVEERGAQRLAQSSRRRTPTWGWRANGRVGRGARMRARGAGRREVRDDGVRRGATG